MLIITVLHIISEVKKLCSVINLTLIEINYVLVTHEFIDVYERHMTSLKFKSFNHFIQTSFGLWRINIDNHNPSHSSCTCPSFYKEYICKHVLGMLIRLKLIICPLKAKDVPIGYTRGVGRPKKAKLALQFQPDYFLDIINDSSDDEDDDRYEGYDENTIRSASNPGVHDVVPDSDDTDVDANEFRTSCRTKRKRKTRWFKNYSNKKKRLKNNNFLYILTHLSI